MMRAGSGLRSWTMHVLDERGGALCDGDLWIDPRTVGPADDVPPWERCDKEPCARAWPEVTHHLGEDEVGRP
jgi:hypothetical protein